MEYMPLYLFATVFVLLLTGYPVAFTLAGTALIFTVIGEMTGSFDPAFLEALPNRLYGIIGNQILMAVPLFVFMGVMLERSRIADELLTTMSRLFGKLRGGLGISVILVGMLLAASTGIVGATVVTMGLLSLPTMLKQGYDPKISTGLICASGTLGQIIPPSIVLVLLGDVLSNAYQQAQLDMGIFSPETISVGDLFIGALIPGLLLVTLYIVYIGGVAFFNREAMPAAKELEVGDRLQLNARRHQKPHSTIGTDTRCARLNHRWPGNTHRSSSHRCSGRHASCSIQKHAEPRHFTGSGSQYDTRQLHGIHDPDRCRIIFTGISWIRR